MRWSLGVTMFFLLYPTASSGQTDVEIWRESTFEEFADGSFGDGGANTYISRKGRIQLVNRWDLNQDGFIDLVFANTHPHQEKLDSSIYWGNGRDFDVSRRSFIPNDGAQWAAAGDLDQDGRMDVVFPNYTNGTWDGMDSFVYFGGIDELKNRRDTSKWGFYPFSRKINLPSRAAQGAVVADFNRDGYTDVALALSAGFWEYRAGFREGGYGSPSRIFWGSSKGLDREGYTDVPALGASAIAVADLNQDDWPDLILANQEDQGNQDINSFILWGGKDGYSSQRKTDLPTHKAFAVKPEDVNGDGRLDLVFANGKGPVSYVYLNGQDGFSVERRIELSTNDARDVAVADFNRDGKQDLFFTNHQSQGNPLTFSYLYWGSEKGFSEQRRQKFETVGAWGVSAADLNRDGYEDLVVSNYKEHFSFDVPSYILWNSPEGFASTRRTSLFTQGAVGNLVTDFDEDGHLDILFNNTVGRRRGGDSPIYVYWGDAKGQYSSEKRISLPAIDPYEWGAADLNDDGWADLLVSNFGETVRWNQESHIYWGGREGFQVANRSALMGHGSAGVAVADLDRDGVLDVLLSNTPSQEPGGQGAFVYWGKDGGFVVTERLELDNGPSGVAAIADLNQDGSLDLIFSATPKKGVPIYWGNIGRDYSSERRDFVPGSDGFTGVEVADLNKDGLLDLILSRAIEKGSRLTTGFVYWGGLKGVYTKERRTEFEIEGTIVITVADVNQDGWLDLVCPNYNTGSSRATLSRVHLGGPDGLDPERMFTLPTNSGTGSLVADFNQDGYADILFVCHRSEGNSNRIGAFGDHATNSFLYWGGGDGFNTNRRLEIPVRGPHLDSGVDLGNIYDRGFDFDYVSSVYKFTETSPSSLSWKAQTPLGSTVRFQIRTASADASIYDVSWKGPGGPGTFFYRPANLPEIDPSHSAIQYRAILAPASTGAVSPVLEEVVILFR